MGYYVVTLKSSCIIKKENQTKAFHLACELNKHDDLKRGGGYSGGKKTASWFSWMDADYDKTCKNIQEVVEMLGFETAILENGDLSILFYDSKTGQEELFFKTMESCINGQILWQGEDFDTYAWDFSSGKMEILTHAEFVFRDKVTA